MFIYGYANPLNKEIFYVGKTNNMAKRNYQHNHFSKGKNFYFGLFKEALRRKNLKPLHFILEVCTDEVVLEREKAWIEYGLAHDWPLTNRVLGKTAKKNGGQAQIEYLQWLREKIEAI